MLGVETCVVRDQAKTFQECLALCPRYVVIGPGPGVPSKALLSKQFIEIKTDHFALLGVCLGHQALAEYYGGVVKRAHAPMHGKVSPIFHQNQGVFHNLPQGFSATRYHSLIVEEETLPSCLEITARADTQEIMGLRHRTLRQESVQFHPESVLTEHGMDLLKNFLAN